MISEDDMIDLLSRTLRNSIVGKISTSKNRAEWEVPEYFNLPNGVESCFYSPVFKLNDVPLQLTLWPNGRNDFWQSAGWVGMTLLRVVTRTKVGPSQMRIGISGTGISEIAERNEAAAYKVTKLILASELESKKDEIVPEGSLHLFCEAEELADGTQEGRPLILREKAICEEDVKKAEEENKKCDDTSDEFKLLADCVQYQNLILDGHECDGFIEVNNLSVPVHKKILRAHSPFFERMFNESYICRINIENCESEAVRELLFFIYSGQRKNPKSSNLYNLFCLAEKCDLQDLKHLCIDGIEDSLSEHNVCDIILIGKKLCNGTRILEKASEFFQRNLEKILSTTEWLKFMKVYTSDANDLLIETVKVRPYRRPMVTNDFREMVYKKMIALAQQESGNSRN